MVSALTKHDIKWLAPAPLWPEFSTTAQAGGASPSASTDDFQRPTLLRFNNDDFMTELNSVMHLYPERLIEWKAQPETWRDPMATPSTRADLPKSGDVSQFEKDQIRLSKKLKSGSAGGHIGKLKVSSVPVKHKPMPLKLYQPAQQRFYLVTASLVCRQMGLPDRQVDRAKEQKVEFVLRRLLPKDPEAAVDPEQCDPALCDEYAYVANGNSFEWQRLSGQGNSTKLLAENEERLPMFNLGYEETAERKRKLLAGFVPVAKRESYMNASVRAATGINNSGVQTGSTDVISAAQREAIVHLFNMQVAGPWKRLISMAYNEENSSNDWTSRAPEIAREHEDFPDLGKIVGSNVKDIRESIQTTSWYILVDMLQFLKDYLPRVYEHILSLAEPPGMSVEELAVYQALAGVTLNKAEYADSISEPNLNARYSNNYHGHHKLEPSLIAALRRLAQNPDIETALDLVDYSYDRVEKKHSAVHDWPDFLFPLADPKYTDPLPNLPIEAPSDTAPDTFHDQLDALSNLIGAAISDEVSRAAPDVAPPKAPSKDPSGGWFIIRCVYLTPNCGPFNPPLVSQSTVPFKLAGFYDPDAPGRPVTIPMPLDISPAGLRKYNKNATFMISDMLCGKLRGARKTTLADLVLSILPWPFHKDLPDPASGSGCSKGGASFGMFCSLSIPIVTICAMILLTIMLTLFNIFFRWIPLFFLCLPIPGLKGKDRD